MLIIGERINSSRPAIKAALEKRDAAAIRREAALQLAAGAEFLDVNCGLSGGREAGDMEWLAGVINETLRANLCIDSPDPAVIEKGVSLCRRSSLINSITAERERINGILPIAQRYGSGIIALTMDEKGMPGTAADRFRIAEGIHKALKKEGIPEERMYFDPLVRPISSEPGQAGELLRSIAMIKSLGSVKVICGISNISYGLPKRALLNATFLSLALAAGLDGALCDPLEKNITAALKAAEAILGNDKYCMNFIQAHRKGLLGNG